MTLIRSIIVIRLRTASRTYHLTRSSLVLGTSIEVLLAHNRFQCSIATCGDGSPAAAPCQDQARQGPLPPASFSDRPFPGAAPLFRVAPRPAGVGRQIEGPGRPTPCCPAYRQTRF